MWVDEWMHGCRECVSSYLSDFHTCHRDGFEQFGPRYGNTERKFEVIHSF